VGPAGSAKQLIVAMNGRFYIRGGGTLDGRYVANFGETHWELGNVTLMNGAIFDNLSGSQFNASLANPEGVVGQFLGNGGQGTWLKVQPGARFVQGGTDLRITANLQSFGVIEGQNGDVTVETPAQVSLGGQVLMDVGNLVLSPDQLGQWHNFHDGFRATGDGGIVVAGQMEIDPGTIIVENLDIALTGAVTGPGALEVLPNGILLLSGRLEGSGTARIQPDANITFNSGTNRRTFYNEGTATITAGGSAFLDAGVFTNRLAGTFTVEGNQSIQTVGAATFVNEGAFTKTGEVGTSVIQVTFENRGILRVEIGTLLFWGSVVQQSPGVTYLLGAHLHFWDAFDIVGGSLVGYGTITAREVVNRSVIEVGNLLGGGISPIGTLVIYGDYRQEATGQLWLDIAAAGEGGSDRLFVSSAPGAHAGGVARLGGSLRVRFINGYQPTATTVFELMGFLRREGTFDAVPPDVPPSCTVGYGKTSVSLTYTA
jgi:hypothetical protein